MNTAHRQLTYTPEHDEFIFTACHRIIFSVLFIVYELDAEYSGGQPLQHPLW